MNSAAEFASAFCVRLVLTFGHFLWEGTVVALLAMAAAVILRNAAPRVRHNVYALALLLMVLCPLATYALLRPAAPRVERVVSTPVAREVPLLPSRLTPEVNESEEPFGQRSTPGTVAVQAPKPFDWQRYAPHAVVGYLVGVVLMLGRLLVAMRGGNRLKKQSEPVNESAVLAALERAVKKLRLPIVPAIFYCARLAVPTVVGVLRPTILLPLSFMSGLSPEQIEMLLLHELAHIRRYDHLVNVAQRLVEAALFFHPAVWFVSRRIRVERELCCDDIVIAAGGQPLAYATSLVQMAEISLASQPTGWFRTAALGAADRSSQLRLRVLRLLDSPGADGFRLARASTLMLSVAGLLALGVAFCLGSPAKARKDAAEAQSPAATVKQTERMDKLPGTMFTPDEAAIQQRWYVDLSQDQYRKRVSLDVQEAPLQDVIRQLMRELGLSVVIDPEVVRGQVTLALKDVPAGLALYSILSANGLELMCDSEGIHRIVPHQQTPKLAEKITVRIPLNWMLASRAKELLAPLVENIEAEPSRNTLIVTDTPLKIEQIAGLIGGLDKSERGDRSVAPTRLVAVGERYDTKVTLSVKDAPLADVVCSIARQAGLNIVLNPQQLRGRVTIDLNDVPASEALRGILRTHGLDLVREDGGIHRLVSSRGGGRVEQRTVYIPLAWIPAAEAKRILEPVVGGSIAADTAGNALIITDTPLKIEQLTALLSGVDTPENRRGASDTASSTTLTSKTTSAGAIGKEIEQLLGNPDFLERFKRHELEIYSANLMPRDVINPYAKTGGSWERDVGEVFQTMLYHNVDLEAARKEGRRLWYDPETFQLTVVDTPENVRKVREFVESLPQFQQAPLRLVTRVYKVPKDLGQSLKTIAEAIACSGYPNDRQVILVETDEGTSLVVKELPANIGEVESLLQDRDFMGRLAKHELEVYTVNVSPHPSWVKTASAEEIETLGRGIKEVVETILYHARGIEAARKAGRHLWYDPRTLQLTIVDTADNIRKVREYIASVSQLHEPQASVQGNQASFSLRVEDERTFRDLSVRLVRVDAKNLADENDDVAQLVVRTRNAQAKDLAIPEYRSEVFEGYEIHVERIDPSPAQGEGEGRVRLRVTDRLGRPAAAQLTPPRKPRLGGFWLSVGEEKTSGPLTILLKQFEPADPVSHRGSNQCVIEVRTADGVRGPTLGLLVGSEATFQVGKWDVEVTPEEAIPSTTPAQSRVRFFMTCRPLPIWAASSARPTSVTETARFEGPLEFDKDTSVALNAGENKAFGYAFQSRSVKFTRRGEEVWASLRFDLQTTAEGTWRIRVALLSPDGQQMGSGETSLTTSLAIRRVPMRRPNQYLHLPLGHWSDVSKATKFQITIARAPDGAPVTAKLTDEPPLSKSPEPTWGEAVEGVQCRLTADKPVWNAGEIPTFKAEVRNQGMRNLSVAQAQQLCEMEFDGRWFVWLGPIDVKSSALDPGRQYANIPITLVSDWRSKDAREPLKLAPGKHTVRIAFIASRQNHNVSPPVRAVSNPVGIEIRGQAAEAGTFVETVAGTTGASRVDLSEAAFQKKVSLDFKDAPLEDVIRFLAREANLNIVMRPEQVRGAVVAEMKEVSVGEALRSILRAHGLELLRDSDGVCRITARK